MVSKSEPEVVVVFIGWASKWQPTTIVKAYPRTKALFSVYTALKCIFWYLKVSFEHTFQSSLDNNAIIFKRLRANNSDLNWVLKIASLILKIRRSSHLIQRIMPDIRHYFEKALSKPTKLTWGNCKLIWPGSWSFN